jgi:hypothetical protein
VPLDPIRLTMRFDLRNFRRRDIARSAGKSLVENAAVE